MKTSKRAAMIAGAYVALAGAWIIFSGQIARSLASSVEELERLERYKGIGFVAFTGLCVFLAAFVVMRRQQADADQAERARETLLKSERNALAGLFVSSIAHDANNITMVVNSALELLRADPGLA